jgi:hypothetical protein
MKSVLRSFTCQCRRLPRPNVAAVAVVACAWLAPPAGIGPLGATGISPVGDRTDSCLMRAVVVPLAATTGFGHPRREWAWKRRLKCLGKFRKINLMILLLLKVPLISICLMLTSGKVSGPQNACCCRLRCCSAIPIRPILMGSGGGGVQMVEVGSGTKVAAAAAAGISPKRLLRLLLLLWLCHCRWRIAAGHLHHPVGLLLLLE